MSRKILKLPITTNSRESELWRRSIEALFTHDEAIDWDLIDDAGIDIDKTISNTFTLDYDNTGGNVSLVFGLTNNKTFTWDDTNNRFDINSGLSINDNLVANDKSLTGINNITFTNIDGKIAEIANKNLLDKTANESIAGDWIHGGDLSLSTFTSGSVLFTGASGLVSQDNSNLFWDDSNNRLGVGIDTPTSALHIVGTNDNVLGFFNLNKTDNTFGDQAVRMLLDSTSTSATATGLKAQVNISGVDINIMGVTALDASTLYRGSTLAVPVGIDMTGLSNTLEFGTSIVGNHVLGNQTANKVNFKRSSSNNKNITVSNFYGLRTEFVSSAGSGTITSTNIYQILLEDGTVAFPTTNMYGLFIENLTSGTNNYGIVLDGDGLGAGLFQGDGQDVVTFYDGTNWIFNPKRVGTGVMLLDTDSKTCYRDTALGVYSQADTFLDLFADGAIRFGDSSAGAPTNYTEIKPDGEINLHGTARVKQHIHLFMENFRKGAAAPTEATVGHFSVYQYSNVVTQTADATFHLPVDWDNSTDMQMHIHWAPIDGNAGDVVFDLDYKAVASNTGEVISGTQRNLTVTDSTQTLQDEMLKTTDVTIPAGDLTYLDTIGICLSRDTGDAADTYNSAVSIVMLEILYISNKIGDAT